MKILVAFLLVAGIAGAGWWWHQETKLRAQCADLVLRINGNLNENNYKQAEQELAELSALDPSDPGVASLKLKFEKGREDYVRELLVEIDAFREKGEFGRAANLAQEAVRILSNEQTEAAYKDAAKNMRAFEAKADRRVSELERFVEERPDRARDLSLEKLEAEASAYGKNDIAGELQARLTKICARVRECKAAARKAEEHAQLALSAAVAALKDRKSAALLGSLPGMAEAFENLGKLALPVPAEARSLIRAFGIDLSGEAAGDYLPAIGELEKILNRDKQKTAENWAQWRKTIEPLLASPDDDRKALVALKVNSVDGKKWLESMTGWEMAPADAQQVLSGLEKVLADRIVKFHAYLVERAAAGDLESLIPNWEVMVLVNDKELEGSRRAIECALKTLCGAEMDSGHLGPAQKIFDASALFRSAEWTGEGSLLEEKWNDWKLQRKSAAQNALLREDLNQAALAIKELREAPQWNDMALSNSFELAVSRRLEADKKLGKLGDMLEVVKVIEILKPDDPQANYIRGAIYGAKGKLFDAQLALEAFGKAVAAVGSYDAQAAKEYEGIVRQCEAAVQKLKRNESLEILKDEDEIAAERRMRRWQGVWFVELEGPNREWSFTSKTLDAIEVERSQSENGKIAEKRELLVRLKPDLTPEVSVHSCRMYESEETSTRNSTGRGSSYYDYSTSKSKNTYTSVSHVPGEDVSESSYNWTREKDSSFGGQKFSSEPERVSKDREGTNTVTAASFEENGQKLRIDYDFVSTNGKLIKRTLRFQLSEETDMVFGFDAKVPEDGLLSKEALDAFAAENCVEIEEKREENSGSRKSTFKFLRLSRRE